MYVGITAAGVFRTDDGGEMWMPLNKNVLADYLPDPYPEVGQCPHKLLLHPAQPERLWQQSHYSASSPARTNAPLRLHPGSMITTLAPPQLPRRLPPDQPPVTNLMAGYS
jgi:hypothetical protein